MARDRNSDDPFGRSMRRVLVAVVIVLLLATFLLWRIDNPRVERFRTAIVDRVVPNFEWALAPVTRVARMVDDFQSYARIYEQNQELRRELQRLKGWREAALQLEQKNAKLLELNNVRLNTKLTYITGVVLVDSGSPFRQSALLNIGARDGIVDGWAAMDGLGLVGRISGVGESTSRVILLTDSNSRVPITIQPSGQKAILVGENTNAPAVEFLEDAGLVQAGDRVVTSGDGGVFPSGLLAGQIVRGPEGRVRVRLAADYQRLEFLQVLRATKDTAINDPGGLVARPPAPLITEPESGDGND